MGWCKNGAMLLLIPWLSAAHAFSFSSTAHRIRAVPAEITRTAIPQRRSPSENEAKELPSSPELLIRLDLSCERESERC